MATRRSAGARREGAIDWNGHAMTRVVLTVVGLVAISSIALSGHEVAVEQNVEVTMRPQGDRLEVALHVPITALPDAKLPTLVDGSLDSARLDRPLQVAADETARNLDVHQDDALLVPSTVTAQQGADRVSIDIDVIYRIAPASSGFSARVNTFRGAPLRPVRTTVRYVPPGRPPQLVSVTGAPTRVRFDPTTIDAVSFIVERALTSTLTLGDHILWLFCLLLPLRTARDATRLVGLAIAAQMLAVIVTPLAPAAPAFGPLAAMIAASVVAMGCLQNVVSADRRWVVALSLVFGGLNGVAFGATLAAERQFAGSHQAVAFGAFVFVVAMSQLWLAAILWATRRWLATVGLPDRIAIVLASAVVAHTAIHRVLDRGHALAEDGSFISARTLTWLTLGWVCTMLVIAVIESIRRRRAGGALEVLSERGHA
jgi:hypothetical protein